MPMRTDYSIVFAINISNIGRASFRPVLMDEWLCQLNHRLRDDPVRFIDYFGHTGNFVVDSYEGCDYATRRLSDLLATPCIAMSIGSVRKCIASVEGLPCPAAESAVRWTPGALFLVTGTANATSLKSVRRAVFQRIGGGVVAAWKRDAVRADGRLNRGRRLGGWGALSHAVGRQLGGVWTARSLSALRGILDRALHPVGIKGRAEKWLHRARATEAFQGDQRALHGGPRR